MVNSLQGHPQPVIQYDIQGNEIARYFSIGHASRKTGISTTAITNACKRKLYHQKIFGGFRWEYELSTQPSGKK